MISFFDGGMSNASLGQLHSAIQGDMGISNQQKMYAMQNVNQDLGTNNMGMPMSQVLPRLGGGVLGYQVGKYMGMSMPGKIISSMAGYGVGKLVSDFYQGYNTVMGDGGYQYRPFGT